MLQHQEVKQMLLVQRGEPCFARSRNAGTIRISAQLNHHFGLQRDVLDPSTRPGSGVVLGKLENASLAVLDSKVETLPRDV